MSLMIFHEVPISASAEKIYQALVTESLLSEWWLKNAKIENRIGGIATFPLSDGVNQIKIRIEELQPYKLVRWTCLGHKHAEWLGTQIQFEIIQKENSSFLKFTHSGWRDTSGVYGFVSYYWAALYLTHLKKILEK